MIIKKHLTEDSGISIFDTGISAEKLFNRKVSLERVLAKAKKALETAEAKGNDSMADRLREKVDYLQELFDRADEVAPSDDTTGGGEDSESIDSEGSGEGSGEGESDAGTAPHESSADEDGDSDTDTDGDTSKEPKSPSEESKKKEKGPGVDPEPTEPEESSEESDEELDGSSGNPETGKEGTSKGKKKGKSKSGDDLEGDDSDDSDDSDDDSDSLEGDDPTKTSETPKEPEDPTEEPDDYPRDPKPVIKGGKELIDPFRRKPQLPTDPELKPSDVEQESVFDAAKRMLTKLSGEHKKGAIQGLKDLLAKQGVVTESLKLQEAIKKVLSQMSDEEFNDELSATMALVDKVIDVEYSDDLGARVKEIKRDMLSPLARAELEKEDAEHVKADRAAAKAAESENDKYKSIKSLDGLEKFKATLYRAIADQVEMAEDEVDSWAALDRRHEDEPDIVKKGTLIDDVPDDIPTVNVYFDQSGSWTDKDIEIGKRAISVINEFHKNGQIKLNILYMSAGGVFTTSEAARAHPSAEGWYDALCDIKSSKVKNVIVLTDDDIDYKGLEWSNRPSGNNGRTFVDGCVWWLWKNGNRSKTAPGELIGRRGNFEYAFESRGW